MYKENQESNNQDFEKTKKKRGSVHHFYFIQRVYFDNTGKHFHKAV
jgi:hypothetical protein